MAGVLSRIKGLVVGQFTDCEPDPGMPLSTFNFQPSTVYATIREAVEAYSYPLLFDFPAGHVEDNRPLYLNHPATLITTGQSASLLQP